MTPVGIVAIADIVLIVCVIAVVLSTGLSQRRERRRLARGADRQGSTLV
jgi:hypothetical protein